MTTRKTNKPRTERTYSFIKKAKELHKDYYSYEKTNVKALDERVVITCPVHGDYTQTPAKHLIGRGCRKCGTEKAALKSRKTVKQFVKEAKAIHKNSYSYQHVHYKNGITPVIIECPLHGNFLQKPASHLSGQGCPVCSKEKAVFKSRKTTQQFISEASKVHNNFYSYEKTVYHLARQPVEIDCPVHGSFFQNAGSHLKGSGCPKCANERKGKKVK